MSTLPFKLPAMINIIPANDTALGFLNGETGTTAVDLAPSLESPYSGTKWWLSSPDGNGYYFKCLGTAPNPNGVWLNGQTMTDVVDLAPNTNDPYSGTKWDIEPAPSGGGWQILCLGKIAGFSYLRYDARGEVFLDTVPGEMAVWTLAPASN